MLAEGFPSPMLFRTATGAWVDEGFDHGRPLASLVALKRAFASSEVRRRGQAPARGFKLRSESEMAFAASLAGETA